MTAVLMVGIFQHPFYPTPASKVRRANMVNVPVPAYTRGWGHPGAGGAGLDAPAEAFKPR